MASLNHLATNIGEIRGLAAQPPDLGTGLNTASGAWKAACPAKGKSDDQDSAPVILSEAPPVQAEPEPEPEPGQAVGEKLVGADRRQAKSTTARAKSGRGAARFMRSNGLRDRQSRCRQRGYVTPIVQHRPGRRRATPAARGHAEPRSQLPQAFHPLGGGLADLSIRYRIADANVHC